MPQCLNRSHGIQNSSHSSSVTLQSPHHHLHAVWHNGMMEFQQWSWWWILYSMAQWHDEVSTMNLMMDSIQHGTRAFQQSPHHHLHAAWHNGMMEFQQWGWWWILYSMAQWHDGVSTMKSMMDSKHPPSPSWNQWGLSKSSSNGAKAGYFKVTHAR